MKTSTSSVTSLEIFRRLHAYDLIFFLFLSIYTPEFN